MGTWSQKAFQNDTFVSYLTVTVAATKAATKGLFAMASATPGEAENATADSDLVIGLFTTTAVAGAQAQVALFAPPMRCLVGTGGSTWGKKQIIHATGVTDAPAQDSDGTGNEFLVGVALDTGIAGDFIGVCPILGSRGSAS